ncbi:aldo/keto reductase [Streptomyces tendae]
MPAACAGVSSSPSDTTRRCAVAEQSERRPARPPAVPGQRQGHGRRGRADRWGTRVSMAAVGLAWVLRNPVITAPIVGATKPHHLADAAAALDLELSWARPLRLATTWSSAPAMWGRPWRAPSPTRWATCPSASGRASTRGCGC